MTRRSYRLDEVAKQTGASVKTLRREIRDGKLRAHRIRGLLVIFPSDLDRWLDGLPIEQSAAPAGERIRTYRAPATQQQPRGRVTRLLDIAGLGLAR